MKFYQNHLLASRRRKEDRPTWRARSSLASSPRRVPGVPKSWQVTPIFGWLVVWNRNFYLYLYNIYIYGNVIIPADFNSMIFQRGVRQPPTSWGWKWVWWVCSPGILWMGSMMINQSMEWGQPCFQRNHHSSSPCRGLYNKHLILGPSLDGYILIYGNFDVCLQGKIWSNRWIFGV